MNLFVNPAGHYVVPITSRTRFVSRPGRARKRSIVTLRVPDAEKITWAHAISADGPSYSARVAIESGVVRITADKHGTATMLVVGQGPEPALADHATTRCATVRESLLAKPSSAPSVTERPRPLPRRPPATSSDRHTRRRRRAGDGPDRRRERGPDRRAREPRGLRLDAPRPLESPPCVTLVAADDGTWFVPERIEVLAPRPCERTAAGGLAIGHGRRARIHGHSTVPAAGLERGGYPGRHGPLSSKTCSRQDTGNNVLARAGRGFPGSSATTRHNPVCVWKSSTAKSSAGRRPPVRTPESLEHPQQPDAQATCWFADDRLSLPRRAARHETVSADPLRARLRPQWPSAWRSPCPTNSPR